MTDNTNPEARARECLVRTVDNPLGAELVASGDDSPMFRTDEIIRAMLAFAQQEATARAIAIGRELDAEDGGYPVPEAQGVEGELERLREEVDRFRRPSHRNLSTRDPIIPLPGFEAQHLRGLALVFREWCNSDLWGRPQEAELAARQVETAFHLLTTQPASPSPDPLLSEGEVERLDAVLKSGFRKMGGVARLARAPGGAAKIREIAIREILAALRRPTQGDGAEQPVTGEVDRGR